MRRYIWEDRDSTGRMLRAYLITDETAHHPERLASPNRVALDTELPALEFRAHQQWRRPFAENSEEWATEREVAADLNRIRAEHAAREGKTSRLRPAPKYSGMAWVRVATVSLREVMQCRSFGMSMGIARKGKAPGMLTLAQLGALMVAADSKLERAA